jgi:O-antigen/teichoic acid export membrane protein
MSPATEPTTRSDRTLAVLGDGGRALVAGQIGHLLLYLAHMLAARWLGAVAYGRLAFGLNLLQVLLPIAGLGLYTAVIRYVAQLLDAGKRGQVRPLLLRFGAIVAISSSLLGLALILGANQWAGLLNRDLSSSFWLLGAILPPMVLTRFVTATMNARGMARRRMLYESLLPSSAFLLALVVLRWVGQLTLASAMAAFGASWLLSLVLGMTSLRDWSLLWLPPNPLQISANEVGRFAAPVWLAQVLHQLVRRLDVLLAGFLLSDLSLGVYSAAAVVTKGLSFALEAFRMAFAPEVAALYGSRRMERLQQLYREGTRLVFEFVLPICLFLVIAGEAVMGLLGSQFVEGAAVLALLALGQMVNFGTGVAGTLLVMSGNQWLELLVVSSSNVVLILLVTFLVPRWGVTGLALAMALSIAFQNISRVIGVYARLRIHPLNRSYGKVLLAGAAGLLGGMLSSLVMPSAFLHSDWRRMLLSGLSIGVFYLGALFVLGLSPLERQVLRRVGSYLTSLYQRS